MHKFAKELMGKLDKEGLTLIHQNLYLQPETVLHTSEKKWSELGQLVKVVGRISQIRTEIANLEDEEVEQYEAMRTLSESVSGGNYLVLPNCFQRWLRELVDDWANK
jgi:hypothetical protein